MAKINLGMAFRKMDIPISSTIYPYRKMPKKAIVSIISITLAHYGYSVLGLAYRYCNHTDRSG